VQPQARPNSFPRRGALFPWWSSLDRSRANAVKPITATRPITANARMVVLSSSEISSNDGGAGPRHGMPGVVSQPGRQGGCGGEGGEGTPSPVSARLRPSTNRSNSASMEPPKRVENWRLAITPLMSSVVNSSTLCADEERDKRESPRAAVLPRRIRCPRKFQLRILKQRRSVLEECYSSRHNC
jgi:hypothetical protein